MSPPGSATPGPRLLWLPWIALVAVAALAWGTLVAIEGAMGRMGHTDAMGAGGLIGRIAHPMMRPDAAAPYLAATALMWVVMMVAMMMPAVLPTARAVERAGRGSDGAHPLLFASGYLGVWCGFGLLAALLQWVLHRSGWLFGEGLALAPALGGGVLVAAGVYQLTPFKDVCLRHCRSPLGFVLEHWRPGAGGAFQMGARHGAYCVGCCWMLMLLMFAGGAMSVLAMAAISVFILLERVLPEGPWVTRAPGFALLLLGLVVWGRG